MKKLLIAMTAAAVGTCAWATEGAGGDPEPTTPTITYLNESFSEDWTLANNAFWSYTGTEETELAITNVAAANAAADYALALNTGSKVLTANFADNKSAVSMAERAYFKSTVTFKDPSDTLPELKDSDKFALVVLDNVESIEEGYTATPATNLWVIAKYGESGQRAYQLDVEVDPTWLAAEHEIVVKAYENVMASGNCAGFLVKVDNKDNDTVCTVVQSCAIVDGVIDYRTSCAYDMWLDGADKNLGYLGYPKAAILGAVQKRYTDATLILSNVPGSDKLTSVDFQGQGVIDNVELATTGAGFGTDSLALTVVADGVALVDTDTTLYFAEVGDTVTIKFTVNEGYELSSPTGLTPVNGVYTYEYTTTANNEKVTISAFLPKVSVVIDGETKKFASLSKAIEAEEVAAGAELTLTDAITLTEAIEVDKNITINLNGKKLSVTLVEESVESMFDLAGGVTLTITDTEGGVLEVIGGDRTIALVQTGTATVAINKGTIDAAAAADAQLSYNITGGKFLKEANAEITPATGYAATDDGNGYWVVAEKPAAPTTFAVTYEAGNFTITKDDAAFTSGTELANGTYTFKVAAAEGYKVDSVTVGGTTATVAEDGTFSVTVSGDDVAIVVTATLKTFAVTSTVATGATVTGLKESYNWGETLTFTVDVAADYENLVVKINDVVVTADGDRNYTLSEVKAAVKVDVSVTKKVVPLQPLPENATDADVSAALGTQADTAVTANITTVADYTAFQAWAEDAGTDKVAGSQNAYAAYVLDAAGLLDETEKLADADIKVKAFAQDTAAGTFALEIKIKDCEIGPNANLEKLAELIIAEGTSELGNAEKPFASGNVTKTVTVDGDKAKFKVNAKDGNVKQFFFKMKFK